MSFGVRRPVAALVRGDLSPRFICIEFSETTVATGRNRLKR
jgi:hypothetical protein